MIRHLPNLVSLIRLFMVPVVVWLLLEERPAPAMVVFVAAAVLDAVDGWLARRFDARSPIGTYLDPLADKALLVGAYVTLGVIGWLPSWLVILVVFRDVLIIGAILLMGVLGGAPAEVRPLGVSKLNTVVQAGLVALVLFAHTFEGAFPPSVVEAAVWLTAATTVASGGAYLYVWGRRVLSG